MKFYFTTAPIIWLISAFQLFSVSASAQTLTGSGSISGGGNYGFITLQVDPAMDKSITNLLLSYGPSSSSMTNTVNLGSVNTFMVRNLVAAQPYCFTAQWQDSTGNTSPPSNLVIGPAQSLPVPMLQIITTQPTSISAVKPVKASVLMTKKH